MHLGPKGSPALAGHSLITQQLQVTNLIEPSRTSGGRHQVTLTASHCQCTGSRLLASWQRLFCSMHCMESMPWTHWNAIASTVHWWPYILCNLCNTVVVAAPPPPLPLPLSLICNAVTMDQCFCFVTPWQDLTLIDDPSHGKHCRCCRAFRLLCATAEHHSLKAWWSRHAKLL